jgi:hypothetical protein
MQITFINDFNNGPQPPFTAQEIASFQQDELAAETMFESTFTDNISLTFNVGFGSYQGQNLDTIPNGMGGSSARAPL